MQRIGGYVTRYLGIFAQIRDLLATFVADPSRFLALYHHLRRQGPRALAAKIYGAIFHDLRYRKWVAVYDTISTEEAAEIRVFLAALARKPKFSILVPVYQTPAKELSEMIASVKGQIYDDWELCIADDASPQPHVREILERAARSEPRIKLEFRNENGNISAASNSALALATGDFLVLLDHDDVLAPHALAMLADAINRHPQADVFYSDEDKLDAKGRRYGAYFKPDWNPELLYGQNFISHLGVYRTSLVRELGGFRLGFEGSQDYDLALRATAVTRGPVVHLPHVLYHWRVYPGATTFSSTQIERAVDAARRAIQEQLAGLGIEASVGDAGYNCHRVIRANPAKWPRVSIVATLRKDPELLADFLQGLHEKTDYPDMEVVVIDSSASERRLQTEMLKERRVRVVRNSNPVGLARTVNEAVRRTSGEIILFLESDVLAADPGWLKEMVLLARQPGTGAVGAKLRSADGKTWFGGTVLGFNQLAGPISGMSAAAPGYFGKLLLTQEMSCVSGACMMVARAAFDAVGGFDESKLAPSFTDIDFCLRLRRAGYRIMWTPNARLHRRKADIPAASSSSNPTQVDLEIAHMRELWGQMLERDPFWNPNLSLDSNAAMSWPPRVSRPWQKTR